VTLEHRGFIRYRGDTAGYMKMMASAQGWPYILDRFRDACANA
jgi:hypothetical protein